MNSVNGALRVRAEAAMAAVLEGRCQALASADRVYGEPLCGEGYAVMAASDRLTLLGCDGAVRLDHERLSAVLTVTPAGVTVEPIVDRKRVVMTFLAALCAGLLAFSRR